ncbi:DUF6248 family natural product biosynthesis protein [Streptomyces sp. N35]|uniref:DUF6248 family natural product biosynthesis protein n=1 Tax=Streptomyces sp. N35 TaxID=2795730 RepID=UPI0018F6A276|nr:DUF6248 family natural product biosynthesis protein [Streptomyces sp. N35]
MTSWLRHIGGAIMGILDPVPSPVPSPMSEQEGAWVREHAWTKGLRKIEAAYPHGFHRWCACERGTCVSCRGGHHEQCISGNGPRVEQDDGTITDRDGFVVAVLLHGPGKRPCRWQCRCAHPTRREVARGTATQPAPPKCLDAPVTPDPAGQLALFGHDVTSDTAGTS